MTVKIQIGDCRELLTAMPEKSVHCVVTSPPYFGLRNYGVDGQIGLEETSEAFIAEMVTVFAEVRHVMKDDATLWLNLGDSYAGGGNGGGGSFAKDGIRSAQPGTDKNKAMRTGKRAVIGLLKPKDLMMIPARVAIALQADGWYLRSEIVWAKPNPMPESVTDRPTSAHEKVFLLSKSPRYFYDAEAVRTVSQWDPSNSKMPDGWDTGAGGHGSFHRQGREKGQRTDKQRGHSRRHAGFNDRWDAMSKEEQTTGANLRNVWNIATKPFSEAHFATFPPQLAETCIKAGCPKGGTVLDPFGGAGTTGLVADRLERNAILMELNPEYAEIARKRIEGDAGMFSDVEINAQVAN